MRFALPGFWRIAERNGKPTRSATASRYRPLTTNHGTDTTSHSEEHMNTQIPALDYRYNGGWTVRIGPTRGVPLSEADVIDNLRDCGWRDDDIRLLIRAERLAYCARLFIQYMEEREKCSA